MRGAPSRGAAPGRALLPLLPLESPPRFDISGLGESTPGSSETCCCKILRLFRKKEKLLKNGRSLKTGESEEYGASPMGDEGLKALRGVLHRVKQEILTAPRDSSPRPHREPRSPPAAPRCSVLPVLRTGSIPPHVSPLQSAARGGAAAAGAALELCARCSGGRCCGGRWAPSGAVPTASKSEAASTPGRRLGSVLLACDSNKRCQLPPQTPPCRFPSQLQLQNYDFSHRSGCHRLLPPAPQPLHDSGGSLLPAAGCAAPCHPRVLQGAQSRARPRCVPQEVHCRRPW